MQVKNKVKKNTLEQAPLKKASRCIKPSHLYLQEQYLKTIPKLSSSKDVLVVYLYKNNIEEVTNLEGFPNMTSLYLQHNEINKLQEIPNLKRLKRLYIGHNRISVLEGLGHLNSIEELHLEKQHLSDGLSLVIDPRTIQALSHSLRILNISHNHITSIKVLAPLEGIRYIDVSHNDLEDIKDVTDTIKTWFYLREATFKGNPFTKKHRYKEEMIANTKRLESLDGKNISEVSRTFIKIMERQKLNKNSKQSINLTASVPGLPKYHPPSIQKVVSASLLRNAASRASQDLIFDERNAPYISWKALPRRKLSIRSPQSQRKNNSKGEVVINTLQIFKK